MSTDIAKFMDPNAMEFAKTIAESDFCPQSHKGKPGNVLVAVQMGAELGLPMLSSLQNIAVINGKPAIYGDGMIALVRASGQLEHMIEEFDEVLNGGTAVCRVKRKGEPEATATFSLQEAQQAGLLNKSGPWKQYTKRMLGMRARGYALRNNFADVMQGLITVEEATDIESDLPERVINPADVTAPVAERAKAMLAKGREPDAAPEPAKNEPSVQTDLPVEPNVAENGSPEVLEGESNVATDDLEDITMGIVKNMVAAQTHEDLNAIAVHVPEMVPEGEYRDQCKRAYSAAKGRITRAMNQATDPVE